jgi:AraC-like DNA-binding protein
MAVKHLGVLGHLFMTCKRADEMFELHARYHALVATASRVRYQIAGDEVQLRLELTNPNGRSESGIRQFMEYSVAGWLNLIDLISDSNEYRPKVIEFPFAAPADNSVQRQVLGCELSYNASPSLCVRFDRHLLNTPYFSSAPNLRATIEQAARQRLRELRGRSEISHSELVNEISEFVRQGLMHGVPSIEQVAAYTGQPVRTLQRLLGEEGVDYRSLVEELRKELAKHYIAQSELSLLDVALMLGFSEQSSFQRAFRRWYGVTPGVYRARHEPR